MKKILLSLLMILSIFTISACHKQRVLDSFVVPDSFDTSKQYEISFWAKNDNNITQKNIYNQAISNFEAIYPNINWHSLEKERVDRGIKLVREQMPNMIINSNNCDWLLECFNNYEYKRLSKSDDWSPKPMHNKYSHMMDALRYAVMGIKEISYLGMNSDGSMPINWDLEYEGPYSQDTHEDWLPATYKKKEKRANAELSY